MRKMPLIIVSLAFLAGCGSNPAERLQGKWQGTAIEQAGAPMPPEAVAWAKGVSFEFKGKKMTVAVPAEEPRSGKFSVKSAKDKDVVLAVAGEGDEPEAVRIHIEGEKKIVWKMGAGRRLTLVRVD